MVRSAGNAMTSRESGAGGGVRKKESAIEVAVSAIASRCEPAIIKFPPWLSNPCAELSGGKLSGN